MGVIQDLAKIELTEVTVRIFIVTSKV